MRADELVGSLQTYQKPKESTFKASKNEEREFENSKKLGREELVHMEKCVKEALKYQRRSNRKLDPRKEKGFEKFGKEKGKGSFKGKKVECLNCGGLGHVSIDYPSPEDIKKSM